MNKTNNETDFDEMPVIFKYTRKEAIQDGVLVDISEMAKDAGFKTPVAMTAEAYAHAVTVPLWEQPGQDETGRTWDVLFLLYHAMGRHRTGIPERVPFQVSVFRRPSYEVVKLVAHLGFGDDGEPVITIMLPGQD